MESALISRVYAPYHRVSSRRIATIPMRAIEIQKVYLRFTLGRATDQDRESFVHWKGWSIGSFIEGNSIEVLP